MISVRRLKRTALSLAVGFGLIAGMTASGPAMADNSSFVVADVADDGLHLTPVLSAEDRKLYEEIFKVQEGAHWKRADKLIAKLSDRLLMGHVLAQRYLHPTGYRSKYKELKTWLDHYADLPQARQIYKLALRRRPANWNYPAKPDVPSATRVSYDPAPPLPAKKLKQSLRRQANHYRYTIRRYVESGKTLASKRMLQSAEVRKLLSDAQYDQLAALQGFQYFIDEHDEWALEWAGKAAKRSGKLVPFAHWAAGLASYRLGHIADAAKYFETVARDDRESEWLRAAGGFWAARSYLRAREPARVMSMLKIAAEYDRTFYGMLAGHVLGREMSFEWANPQEYQAAIDSITQARRGRRAMALISVGQPEQAARELRYLAMQVGPDDQETALGILALANHANLPQLAIRLGETVFPDTAFQGAAYPVPSWQPKGGFRVDPALMFALIRQESRFNPEAKSWAGARGLMQLMPRTASFVTNDRKYFASSHPYLFNPSLNMSIGQKYIEILRDDNNIQGDLVGMLAAWNGGPGNLNKWRRSTDYQDDPLLFIEAIPSRETRVFVEKVLANLWIYRHRLGESAPSLDELASGQWPQYLGVHPDNNDATQQVQEADADAGR